MKKIILLLLLFSGCFSVKKQNFDKFVPKNSKKGDGYIFENNLSHKIEYKNNNIYIIFKTKKNDIENVYLITDNQKLKLKYLSSDRLNDYYYINLEKSIEYYFEIIDGNLIRFYDKTGIKKENNNIEKFKLEKNIQENNLKILGDVIYKLEIDSFYNGDRRNDPKYNAKGNFYNEKFNVTDFEENIDNIREIDNIIYGGDLIGVNKKRNYFKGLNIDTVELSSPFISFSADKSDVIDYRYISPNYFDINDFKNIDFEKNIYTNSDKDFIKLINDFYENNINIIIDVNLNYVSEYFFAFLDVVENGKDSKYFDWFYIYEIKKGFKKIDKDLTGEIKKERIISNIKNMKFKNTLGKPILNVQNEEVKKYLLTALKKWENSKLLGIRISGDKEIIAYLKENLNYKIILSDENTNYNFVINSLKFYKNKISKMEYLSNIIFNEFLDNKIDIISDEYTERVYSALINNNIYDNNNKSIKGDNFLEIRPDLILEDKINELKQIIFLQMWLGKNLDIYYGDEKGMWGGDIPRNRKAMLWEEEYIYLDESDDLFKYEKIKAKLNEKVIIDEVNKKIYYKVISNDKIFNYYKEIIKLKKELKNSLDTISKIINSNDKDIIILEKKDLKLVINKSSKEKKIILDVNKNSEIIFRNNLKNKEKLNIIDNKTELKLNKYDIVLIKTF
ncbi:glycosidase [Hypnocyclicus thermotrophus]|uniref:Glycosidase n=1 Tax=Hypnocyclicus thermotrophus TaxID=1627895 RepID=A0AA46I5D9_9FUSO|nr:alpha amylase N-terminal ig-like domain-containing protein [Hypnocyclicus thermotrophus]TDT69184.1 glycosidase [Hypnocyclicus thermotrophus]